MIPIFRDGKPHRSGDQTMRFVGGVVVQDAKNNFARVQQLNPTLAGKDFAIGRKNTRNANQIVLGDPRIPKGQLETGKFFPVNTDAFCKK